jgi:hypothetical protein
MSHIVVVQTKLHDPAAIAAACQRLNLPLPVEGTARFYSGEAKGLLVQLPGWLYPAVIDMQSGIVRCDTFEGRWGSQEHLDRFLQIYAVERTKLEARKNGYFVSEQTLQDGSIKLQLTQGA